MKKSLIAFGLLVAACIYVVATSSSVSHITNSKPVVTESSADHSINYWESRINAEGSKHYFAGWMELGKACFAKAKETHDPHWLNRARDAEMRSLAIQQTYEAYMAMMHIQDYSHRFSDAIQWGNKAMDASTNGWNIPDPAITSSLVEAYIGLGQLDQARKLLPPDGTKPNRFYTAAAWAQWMLASGKYREASDMFNVAATLAKSEGSQELSNWAKVASAGALLDGNFTDEARQELSAFNFESEFLTLHRAELAMKDGKYSDALSLYEKMLSKDPNPETERLAFLAAKKANDTKAANQYFGAAEKSYKRAMDMGEVYTLGALAQLYADAGVNLQQAKALSEENLKFKRDAAAQNTYKQLHLTQ